MNRRKFTTDSAGANLLIALMALFGVAALADALIGWSSLSWTTRGWNFDSPTRFLCFFGLAILSANMKVKLPGIDGTMSVVFLFTLIGIEELSLAQTIIMIVVATLAQLILFSVKRPLPVQAIFNASSVALAVYAASAAYHFAAPTSEHSSGPIRLIFASATYFLFNTFPVAAVISLTENRPISRVWHECYFWSFPYYLVGAAIAGMFSFLSRQVGWETTILILPVVYAIYRSYRLYLGRLNEETQYAQRQKKHAEELAALHLRTIEALALAIDAKDQTTHDHLRRVQVYAVEIGKVMGLPPDELDALRAASLLHDIGKLAVPEHIISKPGRLTVEEFEKMKIHPMVGAEILEQVQFPYPVVPIVRAHHERWDGTGYPLGLKAEAIPMGARILSAVDCLDALASDRQYRRALPLDDAMQVVVGESGKAYDPEVVRILEARYRELEAKAQLSGIKRIVLSRNIKIEKGKEPAAGFESSKPASTVGSLDFLQSIASAREEVQALLEVSHDLGASLSLSETLSVLALRLKRIIPHDAIAFYVTRNGKLIPEFVSGDDFRLFSSLEIPIGLGLSGWVAENLKPILNGNPSVEPAYLNDPAKSSNLKSALAVPLEGLGGLVGVLTLYQAESDSFTRDHLRIVKALSTKVALAIENALKFRHAEDSAVTDYLTGLPNARSLFITLDRELKRCQQSGIPLTVLVCDLDGFKLVNDRHGHLVGNRVLQQVAKGLKQTCRESDYVARMGGDEFVLLLPGLGPESLAAKVDQLKRTVLAAGRQVCGENMLSSSVGAAFSEGAQSSAEQMLAEADRSMYLMKARQSGPRRAGRDALSLEALAASTIQ